ncbi:4689_t:CDS:2 [Scutellospora calospora]|uniref:4689_t:CDS:1 n=1 Tax=Scutellospora calospora TaxID=85575 RepID=A0ACA9JTP9_9GLOM|nr:4689_t:CDS:2 [Scutellospora calospora]
MRFNANYWIVEEKETKVLECNLVHPGKPNSLNITTHLSWNYVQQIQLPYSSQQEFIYLEYVIMYFHVK